MQKGGESPGVTDAPSRVGSFVQWGVCRNIPGRDQDGDRLIGF